MDEVKYSQRKNINICHGYLLPPFTTTEWLEQVSTSFQPRDSDVFVLSFPKSGTHWLCYIIYLLEHKEKASKKIMGTHVAVLDMPQIDFEGQLPEIKSDRPLDLTGMKLPKNFIAALPDPRLFFSHMPHLYLPKNPSSKYLYIYRNLKDALVSMYNFYQGRIYSTFNGTFTDFFNFAIENNCFNYCEHLKGYFEQNKEDENVHILSYEQLQFEFKAQVEGIARFMGCELTDELFELIAKETGFESMRENECINVKHLMKEDSHFMNIGKVGYWREIMSEEQSKKIDEILLSNLGKDFVEKHIIFEQTT